MRKGYHVRWRRQNVIVPSAEWNEWIGPVYAPGPHAAAKAIVLAEDWSDVPMHLVVQVYDSVRDYEYQLIVDHAIVPLLRAFVVVDVSHPI